MRISSPPPVPSRHASKDERDRYRQFIIHTTPVGPGDIVLGEPVKIRVLHSIYTASNQFGAHPKRLRKILAANHLLPEGHSKKTDHCVLFDAKKAEALHKAGFFDGLSLQEFADYIGASLRVAPLLVDAGVVKPVVTPGDIGARTAAFSFARKDVDDFLSHLQQDAIPVKIAKYPQFDIPSAAKRANCSALEIVHLILSRELKSVWRLEGKKIFASILVDANEIKTRVQKPDLDGLPAYLVAKKLKLHRTVIDALINNGILKTIRSINPVNRCPVEIVPNADIEIFRSTYISLAELANQRRQPIATLKKTMENQDIKPAIDETLFHATIYLRTATTPVKK